MPRIKQYCRERGVVSIQIAREHGGLSFARECATFHVLGWPIRLRQTFDVARQGLNFVVRRSKIERL